MASKVAIKSSLDGSDPETTVYVSNVAFSVTEDSLRNILEGELRLPVTKITIPKDKMTGKQLSCQLVFPFYSLIIFLCFF